MRKVRRNEEKQGREDEDQVREGEGILIRMGRSEDKGRDLERDGKGRERRGDRDRANVRGEKM